MIKISLQFFGGRGGSGSGGARGGGRAGGGATADTTPFSVPQMTKKQVDSLSRGQLETMAKALYVNEAMTRGMSKADALSRFNSLVDGNSSTYLKKYIKRRI